MKPSSLEDTRENQDDRYSPTGSARDLYRQEAGAHDNLDNYDSSKDGLDDHPISGGDASGSSAQEDRNIADARDRESNPMGYTSSANQSGDGKSKGKFWSKTNLKKKGPLGLIIGLFLTGGIGGSILLAPGIGIVHLKETLTNKLDSQIGAIDKRGIYVMAAKTQVGGSVCSNVVNIRCKFSSLSDRRIDKLQKNGFTITKGDSKIPGRSQVGAMKFTDKAGKVHDIKNPGQLRTLLATSSDARSSFRSAYNSRFENFAGRAFSSVMKKIPGVNKTQKIPDTSDKEKISKSITEASKGRPIDAGNGLVASDEDEDKKKRDKKMGDLGDEVDKATESGVKATTTILKGAARGVGALGALDTACVAKNTMSAIEVGAKVVRSRQLVNFAMIFLSAADAIKAGDATPNQVSAVGDILTTTDEREFIVVKDEDGNDVSQKNPYYKKSAFDSVGYKSAAYDDKLNHNFTSLQYLVGGTPGIGVLSTITSAINNKVSDGSCKVIQNPFTRVFSFGLGIVLGITTGGVWLAASIGASMAVAAAIPFLESMLIDMLAGMAVDASTVGPAAGDAITSGTAFMLMTMAQANGMQPGDGSASNIAYNQSNTLAVQDSINYQTTMARATPFDVNNPYSFLGRVSGALYPSVVRASTSGASTLASIASLPTLALQSLIPNTSAADGGTTCSDPTYESIGLEPQSMCHLSFYMTDTELNMDPYENAEWMVNSGNVDDETGTPKGKYAEFLKNCVERMDGEEMVPFGNEGGGEDDDKITNGTECLDQSSNTMKDISRFRVYTMDLNISDSIDYETTDEVAASEVPRSEVIESTGTWSSPAPAYTKTLRGFGYPVGYDSHVRNSNGSFGHNGVDLSGTRKPEDAVAACDGVVSASFAPAFNKVERTEANTIVVDCGGDITIGYHHARLSSSLKNGDIVKSGEAIGRSDLSGVTTGYHIHLTVRQKGSFYDPVPFFKERGIDLLK